MPLARHASTSSEDGEAKGLKKRGAASSSSFGLNKLQGRVTGIKEYAVSCYNAGFEQSTLKMLPLYMHDTPSSLLLSVLFGAAVLHEYLRLAHILPL